MAESANRKRLRASISASKAVSAGVSDHMRLPSMRGLRKTTAASSAASKQPRFDPLMHSREHSVSVTALALPDLDSIPTGLLLVLLEEYLPPAPKNLARPLKWDINEQMRAAAYSPDILKQHCLRSALSWGL
jgi:hypothetical protein